MAANLRCTLVGRILVLGALCLFGVQLHSFAGEVPPSEVVTPELSSSPAIPVIRLVKTTQSMYLGASILYLIDSSKSLTITDLQRPDVAARFQRSRQAIPNFGFAKPTFWFVFSLQNTTPTTDDWLLDIAYQPLDSVEVFEQKSDGTWQSALFGDMLPFRQRIVDTRTFVVPLHLPDTLVHRYAIRINTESSVQVPLILRHSSHFAEDLARSELAYGVFFGVMMALILYNLFLFISLRTIYYLYYILYLLGATLYIAVVNGYAAQYLWGDFPRWANFMNIASIGMMICGISIFTRQFLQVKRYVPKMAVLLIISVFGGVSVIFGGLVLPYRIGVQMSVVVNILSILIVVTSGALVWKRGNASARYFFLAAALFLTGNILFVMKTVGALSTNSFTNHVAEIGIMVEGLLFAFALADRYRRMRQDRERAQQESLRMELEAKMQLERKVQERTAELEAMNEEMQRQLVILNDQAVEIEMANVQLQEKNLQLENLNREKNEFMGIAVHDLKNPLQTIIMNTSMMRRYREKMDNEQRDYLFERIEETTRRMHDIIVNLLDSNAIETGNVVFNTEAFPICKETRALADDYNNKALAKGITVHFETEDEHLQAFADKHRVMEAIENLISNAVKFSPNDKNVWIRVGKDKGKKTNKTDGVAYAPSLLIEVQDEGPGLSEDDKLKLFGKFARLSARPTGGEHSTGLGLSIVKRLIEAMNGQIWCESEEGKGATFVIRLPMAT